MEILKLTIVRIRTKISTMLHLTDVSSHKRIEPRLSTDTIVGGANQSPKVASCFVSGQANEKIKSKIASALPPAK